MIYVCVCVCVCACVSVFGQAALDDATCPGYGVLQLQLSYIKGG